MAAAYSDQPLVTRFTDVLPSSSASIPSVVARMLLLAGLAEPPAQDDAQARVLELGAGTGFNAGLLCALVGDEQVTSVDLDLTLATGAQENLKRVGHAPTVAAADGALGWPPNAPYDVVLATFSVDHIPLAWQTQLRPGGHIVTQWTSAWCSYGTLETHRRRSRPGARTLPPLRLLHADGTPRCIARPADDRARARRERSRALLDGPVAVGGSCRARRLWDEITAAYRRWEELGRPSVDRYGLTMTSGGTAVWVDSPAITVAAR
ncbi:methyltransferase domain-containing protein [Streptomyces sp. NPDC059496]|uniref:methyltransferase domain-containing protein n=1 Tax=Streptomyces sp. NPDC059496 TaxID=3346851 RepID=UPI00369F66DC